MAMSGVQVLAITCGLSDGADLAWWQPWRTSATHRPWLPWAIAVQVWSALPCPNSCSNAYALLRSSLPLPYFALPCPAIIPSVRALLCSSLPLPRHVSICHGLPYTALPCPASVFPIVCLRSVPPFTLFAPALPCQRAGHDRAGHDSICLLCPSLLLALPCQHCPAVPGSPQNAWSLSRLILLAKALPL